MDAVEWYTFVDPDKPDRYYNVNVTWLLSTWSCLYGNGCPGLLEVDAKEQKPDVGCCSIGAYFSNQADIDRTAGLVEELTAEDWQHREEGLKNGWMVDFRSDKQKEDDREFPNTVDGHTSARTRVFNGGCIFANRFDHLGAKGCAFHVYAARVGKHYTETKPEVCWSVPHSFSEEYDPDTDIVTLTIDYVSRDAWGGPDDYPLWWCADGPEAYQDRQAIGGRESRVYVTERETLIAGMGSEAAYNVLAAYLDARVAAGAAALTSQPGTRAIVMLPLPLPVRTK